jgi:hypothetical protein
MRRLLVLTLVAALGSSLPIIEAVSPSSIRSAIAGQAPFPQPGRDRKPASHVQLPDDARSAFIAKAQVWKPTDIATMDLRSGPQGSTTWEPNQVVTCDYVERPMHGNTRKFFCQISEGDIVKVRYGDHNGEVQGSVLATRLLWALGFVADRVYPVRVRCRGCSSDPWNSRARTKGVTEFDPAVIERKPAGREMWNGDRKSGWVWPELDLVDPGQGGAPLEHRDALKLLAVFMQHADTKRQQQRLLCAADSLSASGVCEAPFLLLHDVGVTFGRANGFNHNGTGSVNLAEWRRTPVWKDAGACIGDLSKSHTGSLGDPQISEKGRQFLADLLAQLTDQQVRELFEVAGVERRGGSSDSVSAARIDEWIAAFNHKRDEIASARCDH